MTTTQAQTPGTDRICERVHQSFVDFQKNQGNNSYVSHGDEELMVSWNQLSEEAKNRYRQFCQWHIDALNQETGLTINLEKPKVASTGA
jgi:hypothetical protein